MSTEGSTAPRIIILGRVDFEPGHRERWLEHIDALVAATRAEPGCRRYDVLADPASPTGVMAIEIYDSADAFAAHGASSHLAEFLAKTKECKTRQSNVEMYEATSVPTPW